MRITVIIPMYNAERYIKKCIQSVFAQTYSDWNLIVIDDGSTDNSLFIVKKLVGKDPRVNVIHQCNSGPGGARNKGIEAAGGDYVVFLDADDFIDNEYFALLAKRTEDVVFIDVHQLNPSGCILKKEKMSVFSECDKDTIIRSQMTSKIPWGGVRKAVSATLLKKNKINFTLHSIGEEALYSFRVLYAANTIGFIKEKALYFYVNHSNSQSKLAMDDPWGGIVNCLRDYFIQQDLYEKFADTLNAFNVTATVVSLDRINRMYHGEQKRLIAINRMDRFKRLYDRHANLDYPNMSYKAKIFTPFLLNGYYWPVMICSSLKATLSN